MPLSCLVWPKTISKAGSDILVHSCTDQNWTKKGQITLGTRQYDLKARPYTVVKGNFKEAKEK